MRTYESDLTIEVTSRWVRCMGPAGVKVTKERAIREVEHKLGRPVQHSDPTYFMSDRRDVFVWAR